MSLLAPPASDLEVARFKEICIQSFGGKPTGWDRFFESLGTQNVRLLKDGDRLVAGLGIYRIGQWFGGRSLPMAGIATVAVPPEARGQGLATRLMAEAVRELRAEFPLSVLFPSTQRLYRSAGWEQAGNHCKYSIKPSDIGVRTGDLEVRRVAPGRREHFEPLYETVARQSPGFVDRDRTIWDRVTRILGDETVYAYQVGPQAAPEGYVVYAQDSTSRGYTLRVRDFVATTPRGLQALWSLLASNHTLGQAVHWCGPAMDPRLAVLPEQDGIKQDPFRWMLRILDVPRALTQRGYPAKLVAELHLEIADAIAPENAGRFVLRVEGGEASVEAGGRGDLSMDVRGLAPLYTGFLTPAQLANLGWVQGGESALETATRIFAGAEPWTPDSF